MGIFAEVYATLCDVISKSPEVRACADVVDPTDGVNATERRLIDDGERVRINLVPAPGGSVEQISSSSTRILEKFRITPTAGHLSHSEVMALKWALIQTLWKHRNLDLSYVENTRINTVERESALGTGAVTPRDVTWSLEIEIEVAMLLSRNELRMS